jgi:hypothetical protein
MFSVWTEWTHVAGRLVNKTMPYHFVLSFKAFATFGAWAAGYWAVMRSVLRMYVCV